MRKNISYKEWLALSDAERKAVTHSWNPYEGDGAGIVREAFARFQEDFGKPEGVVNMHCGLYHGGVLIIGVTVKKGSHVRVPRSFEGFPVVKMVKSPVAEEP